MSIIKKFLSPLKETGKYLLKKPFTVMYPREPAVVKERWRGIHQLDWNKCIGCGMCARTCPNATIDYIFEWGVDPRQPKNMKMRRPTIDYGHCAFCGLCVEACPTGALKFTPNYRLFVTGNDRIGLIKLPYEISQNAPNKNIAEKEKIQYLLQTDLIARAVGGEQEDKIRELQKQWLSIYYDYLDKKITEDEFRKRTDEITKRVLDLVREGTLPVVR
ncbi:MAG: NuoI/complex I 23 kDa subunit family protein [Candidatus Njordarchaeales archaeon]